MIELLKNMMQIADPHHLEESIAKIFNNLPMHVHYKDRKGRYIDFNKQVVIDAGFSESTNFRGLTDLDFNFLKEGEALQIRSRDFEVITQDTTNIHVGPLSLHNGISQEISIKNPLKSKFAKKIIGVMTCAFVLRENNPLNLNAMNYEINANYQKLSNREKQCLKLYLSGETTKGTALILGISHRSVDDYINNIKKKFQCDRKRELLKLFSIVGGQSRF